jgi:hypothetical protein
VYYEIVTTVTTDVFGLIGYLHQAKSDAIGDEWSQEFVVIAGYEHHTGATLGMAQDPAYHVGVALFPSPPVTLYLPSVDDVAHKIQCVAGIVFEEVVESPGLAVSGAEMHVRNEDRSVGLFWHTHIYCDARKVL